MLSRGELFFASADELNDGSECRPRYILKGSVELWTRLCDYLLLQLWMDFTRDETAPKTDPNAVAAFAEQLARTLRKRVARQDLDYEQLWPILTEEVQPLLKGTDFEPRMVNLTTSVRRVRTHVNRLIHENRYMACFSLDPRDPTMWGHYAGAERGFCIVLHATGDKLRIQSPAHLLHGTRPSREPGVLELGIYKDAEVPLEPVKYLAAPPRVNAFRCLVPHFLYSEAEDHYDVPLQIVGDAPERQEHLFGLVKALTWKYEREVRAFLPADDELTPEARCLQMSWARLQGLIFGPKMSNAHKERAIVASHLLATGRAVSESRSEPFVFFQARQQLDNFQMTLSPVGVLQGQYARQLRPFVPLSEADQATVECVRTIAREMAETQTKRQSTRKNAR